jgi:hypothetical protein
MARIEKGCELTGLSFELQPANQGRKSRSPSVDRRDCAKGYTEDNCRVILWGLNAALHNWGETEYRAIAEAYFKCFP